MEETTMVAAPSGELKKSLIRQEEIEEDKQKEMVKGVSEGSVVDGGRGQTVSILGVSPTRVSSEPARATVFVGAGSGFAPAKSVGNPPSTWRRTPVPEVQTVNGYETKQKQEDNNHNQNQSISVVGQHQLQQQQHQNQNQNQNQHQNQHQNQQSAQHVVKIRINPEIDSGRVISTVRLISDENDSVKSSNRLILEKTGDKDIKTSSPDHLSMTRDDVVRVSAKNLTNERVSGLESCVRISVVNGKRNDIIQHHQQLNNNETQLVKSQKNQDQQRDDMVQQHSSNELNATSLNRSSGCFYYGSFQNPLTSTMVISSGQSSPSDTLDSGTCSDLDGTPPPLPKKKNSSTVLLGITPDDPKKPGAVPPNGVQETKNGNFTNSGVELDSDDNESNISCDSLNSADLAAQNGEIEAISSAHSIAPTVFAKDVKTEAQNVARNQQDLRPKSLKLRQVITDQDKVEPTPDLEYNNNNNNNSISYYCKNVENGMGGKRDAEEDMNERNNGNTATGRVTVEVISDSCDTRRTSPSVSPSASGASSLSKASTTPRVRSPILPNGCVVSPVVKECTYEERKREQDRIEEETAAADYYANYNRKSCNKYLYDDDRFYKFHINEHQSDGDEEKKKGNGEEKESEEFFAGYKILDREAIRSAKGTVRGVKNRVRAGIATFLQKPSSKDYKAKDAGKVVVYTTTMSIVRETYFACIKMLQILKTHMVKYEVRDMFMSKALQTELKERIGCETIEVPQLFIDGQYIGNADAVEHLNESGELRRMFKPYKSSCAFTTCFTCGGCRLLPCTVCNGSKKSPVRNDFMREFCWLRCMNCDEVGLVRCPHC